ncbi:MAG: hypothetical protein P1P84_05345 [Deferrisomatales bacterium]|nr:hypothetical protein [Deferrisomatales bacterium]
MATIRLREFMESTEGWGRAQGRVVYQRLMDFVEANPGKMVFKVSLEGVRRLDISFASETIVELARRYRGSKGFCFIDLTDPDMTENWEAAAARKSQPLMVWNGDEGRVIGVEPSQGNLAAFRFTLGGGRAKAAEFAAATPGISITNASTKFKQLWQQGFLLRREDMAGSGGVEYSYHRIG